MQIPACLAILLAVPTIFAGIFAGRLVTGWIANFLQRQRSASAGWSWGSVLRPAALVATVAVVVFAWRAIDIVPCNKAQSGAQTASISLASPCGCQQVP